MTSRMNGVTIDYDRNHCREDGGEIVWDEDRGAHLCEVCGKAKCRDCNRNLAIDEDLVCDRCRDKREQIMVGIY